MKEPTLLIRQIHCGSRDKQLPSLFKKAKNGGDYALYKAIKERMEKEDKSDAIVLPKWITITGHVSEQAFYIGYVCGVVSELVEMYPELYEVYKGSVEDGLHIVESWENYIINAADPEVVKTTVGGAEINNVSFEMQLNGIVVVRTNANNVHTEKAFDSYTKAMLYFIEQLEDELIVKSA